MVKLSVIVSIYNTMPHLKDTLESIHIQSMRDMEVLCINDCSTDSSSDCIDEYCKLDSRFSRIDNPSNMGVHMARKNGVKHATGEYVWMIDGDDTIVPDCCTEIVKMMDEKNVDILHFGSKVLNSGNLPVDRVNKMQKFVDPYEGSLEGKEIFTECFETGKYGFSSWNKIYKSELIKESFSQMSDGLFKAQDKYEYFITSYLAKSYYGTNSIIAYEYHFGAGSTGKNVVNVNQFKFFCTMSKSAENVKSFIQQNKLEQHYQNAYTKLYRELLDDCVANWYRVENSTKSECFDLMNQCWRHSDIIASIARKSWNDNDTISNWIRDSTSIVCNKRDVKTIGTYYHKYSNGGIQRVLSGLMRYWTKMGYNVVFFTDEPPSMTDYELPDNVTRVVIPSYFETNKDNYVVRANKLEEQLLKYNVDIMITHAWVSDTILWDMLVCKLNNIPTITYCHNIFALLERNLRKSFASMSSTYNLMDGIVTLNAIDTAYWSNFNDRVFETLNPLTFNPKEFEKANLESKNILWIGRISNEKNPLDALKIFNIVHDEMPDATLTIVGEGDPNIKSTLKRYIQSHNLEKSVTLKGFILDVVPEYYSSSVVLCTSEYEGFLLTLAESLSLGIPCVLYQLPYLKIIREGGGFIQVPQNDCHGAATCIVELLKDIEYRRKIGQMGKDYTESLSEFDYEKSWKHIIDKVSEGGCRKKLPESTDLMWSTLFDFYKVGVMKNKTASNANNNNDYSQDPLFMQNVGRAYRDGIITNKDLRISSEWMGRAYDKTPRWIGEYLNLLWQIGDEESVNLMKEISEQELKNNNVFAIRGMARYYTFIGNDAKSREYYDRAMGIKPEFVLFEYLKNLFSSTSDKKMKECFVISKKYSEYGYKDALYWLGMMYYYGKGTKKDLKKSKEFFIKASDAGSTLAKEKLEQLNFKHSILNVFRIISRDKHN